MDTAFSSVPLAPALREPLLERLAAAHAVRPLLPDDPREVAGRVIAELSQLGLAAVRIRGTVSWRGVEVDHVWLAISAGDGDPWVLDAAFPLHDAGFAGSLAGWVAGTTSIDELVALAVPTPLEDRVIGAVPAPAVYRGQPYWSSRQN